MNQPTVIDLFAGVGGLSLGAARAGFTVSLAVERDKHALKAHKNNFPNVRHLDTDIAKLSGSELLRHAGLKNDELDGLIGGPPCQGFSSMGHRRVGDERNNLFQKFFRLIAETKPKFFVAENVLGILDPQYSAIRKSALAVVQAEYTVLEPMKFKASDYGAPTSRERVFFIGFRKNLGLQLMPENFYAQKVKKPVTVKHALQGLPDRIFSSWLTEEQGWRPVDKLPVNKFTDRIVNGIPQGIGNSEALRRLADERMISGCLGTRHTEKVTARYARLKPGQKDQVSKSVRLDPDGLCPTLRAGTDVERGSYQAVRPIHPTASRVITPREAARLQGFPDWFQFAPSKWHSFRQIGNSVSPFVAEAVLSTIASALSTHEISTR